MKLIGILFTIVLLIALFIIINYKLFSINYDRTLTKALCDRNICRDFFIVCKNEEIVEMKPISGFVIFESEWIDKRENKELC